MINGKIRTFSKSTPKEIVEEAKKINEKLIRTAGRPFFFFEDDEEKEQS